MVKLTGIPMVPSMNQAYPSNRRTGRRFKSKEFRAWEAEFELWCLSNAVQVNEARRIFSSPKLGCVVRIHTQLFFKRERIITKKFLPMRNDSSNRLKILHDAVSGAIWCDDSFFWDGTFSKRPLSLNTEIPREFCNVFLEWMQAPWMLPENVV